VAQVFLQAGFHSWHTCESPKLVSKNRRKKTEKNYFFKFLHFSSNQNLSRILYNCAHYTEDRMAIIWLSVNHFTAFTMYYTTQKANNDKSSSVCLNNTAT